MKDRIRQIMEAQHMNQQTFAQFTGIGSASLSSIFTGRTRPTLNHVDAIIDKFPNVNPMWLLKGIGGMFLLNNDNATEQPASQNGDSPTPSQASSQSQAGDIFSSANVSAEPSLFDQPQTSAPRASSSALTTHNTLPNFRFETEMRQQTQPPTPPRKITEIRIFYDDQTWESFVPKK